MASTLCKADLRDNSDGQPTISRGGKLHLLFRGFSRERKFKRCCTMVISSGVTGKFPSMVTLNV